MYKLDTNNDHLQTLSYLNQAIAFGGVNLSNYMEVLREDFPKATEALMEGYKDSDTLSGIISKYVKMRDLVVKMKYFSNNPDYRDLFFWGEAVKMDGKNLLYMLYMIFENELDMPVDAKEKNDRRLELNLDDTYLRIQAGEETEMDFNFDNIGKLKIKINLGTNR